MGSSLCVTDAIVVSGSVNPDVVGTYTLNYSVSDRATNTSRATRTVQVGVNAGAGGGGGGLLSAAELILLLALLAACRARHFPGREVGRLPVKTETRIRSQI